MSAFVVEGEDVDEQPTEQTHVEVWHGAQLGSGGFLLTCAGKEEERAAASASQ